MTQLPRWHWIAPIIFGVFLIWFYPQTGWDHALIAPYYDAQQGFFLRNETFLTLIMHDGIKTLLLIMTAGLLLLWAWSWIDADLQIHRRRIGWIFLGFALSIAAISALKNTSIHACPWDMASYGAYAPDIPLFGSLPNGMKPGRCFPGGHASGGYALLAFYFGLLTLSKRWAYRSLAAGLVLGTVMGWTQMMRGAHFLSHNLWTLFTVWCVLTVFYFVWPPAAQRQVAVCHA
jgi:membrane-associated PAP2 superfamily phosphatase